MTRHLEPMVSLPDGSLVYLGVHELLTDLLASGHHVAVSSNGTVMIDPAVHSDCVECLQRNVTETLALLQCLQRVH